jgi:preprotein translocase subunit SecE
MIDKIIDYVKKVKAELEKVAWPTRAELMNSTGVVLVLVVICSVFLGLVDKVLSIAVTGFLGI